MRVNSPFPVLLLSFTLLAAVIACGPSSSSKSDQSDTQAAAAATAEAIAAESGYVTSASAGEHVGDEVTVRGLVSDYQFIYGTPGKPTLLLFDVDPVRPAGSYAEMQVIPKTFTALIWQGDKKNFPNNPGPFYSGKTLCVTGTIEIWDDKPVIIAKDESQIQVDC